VESLAESILVFGRASLGAAVGLGIGWATQRAKHSRYVVALVLAGFGLGVAAMWPHWPAMLASVLILPFCVVGALVGAYAGVATLGTREDWWLRSWIFAGFVISFQLLALLGALLINLGED
jgi:hypothetical protein